MKSTHLCECGCGQFTTVADDSDPRLGHVKGEPRRFAAGHYNRPSGLGPNPGGLCLCGCGKRTALARQSDRTKGNVAGQPQKFFGLHGNRGESGPRLPRLSPDIREFQDAFWSKVDRSGGEEACWPHRNKPDDKGYMRVTLYGQIWPAHRLAYRIANGEIPEGQIVMHRCDNPPCCNPKHLRAGTYQDNMDDMWAKGRGPSGEKHGSRTHPERWARGDQHWSHTKPERISRGDQHYSHIHPERVVRGERHGFVKNPNLAPRGERHGCAKITEDMAREIRRRGDAGETLAQVARELGVSRSIVYAVASRQTWRHLKD